MAKKQFVILGLGRFGAAIATTVYNLGHDVLVIDVDEERIREIADNVTHAVQTDATDEKALKTLGISNFDVAVVTIGSNIQASIMATLLVKELGVKYIIAKGNSDLHAKVLYKIGANRVILPERDMGVRVAHNLVSSNILDYIELSPEYSMIEIEAGSEWTDRAIKDLRIRERYGINVVAIKASNGINMSPSADYVIKEKDVLVVLGSIKDLRRFENIIVKKD